MGALLLLCLAAPGAGAATGAVLSSDPSAVQVDVLNGVVVWAADRRVFVRRAGVTRRTPRILRWDAPGEMFEGVRSGQLDLGLDERGRVVAAFNACAAGCTPQVLDVTTMRIRPLRVRAAAGCQVGPAALWRTRTVYVVRCSNRATHLAVRERGVVRRVGPRGWPFTSNGAPVRIDLRGRVAVSLSGNGAVTLLDTQRRCRSVLSGDNTNAKQDSSQPYSTTISPHLNGELISWGSNSFTWGQTTKTFIGTTVWAMRARSNCRGLWSQPIRTVGGEALSGEATSVALDGQRRYVTLRDAGLVAQPLTRSAS